MTLGQWYHALKDLALGKYHTKFQLSSPKSYESYKLLEKHGRKIASKLAGKLQPGCEHIHTGTDITSWRNAICPTPVFSRPGHKKKKNTSIFQLFV